MVFLILFLADRERQAMATIVQCNCGAEYRRTEEKFLIPHTGDAICTVCGAALESWSESAHVPSYELIERPDRSWNDRRPRGRDHGGGCGQLKSGLTSAPRLPLAWQTNRALNVRQADVVGLWVAADRDRMRALIVGAIDEQLAHAHLAHLAERDLLRTVRYS